MNSVLTTSERVRTSDGKDWFIEDRFGMFIHFGLYALGARHEWLQHREEIAPEDYAKYYSLKQFRYNNITQPNRNRLLFIDPTVDGVKTGHTDSAGYCLIASAKRNDRRLLSVVVGTTSDSVRAQESQKLLNWGYLAYDTVKVYSANQAVNEPRVWKGKENTVKAGFLNDFVLSVPKGDADKLKANVVSQQPLLAPIAKGQQIGTLQLSLGDKPIGEYPLVAIDEVPQAGWFGRLWDALRLWIKNL